MDQPAGGMRQPQAYAHTPLNGKGKEARVFGRKLKHAGFFALLSFFVEF